MEKLTLSGHTRVRQTALHFRHWLVLEHFSRVVCRLYGTYQPFDDATLAELYPSRRDYVSAVVESARANVDAGYLLSNAVQAYRRAAWQTDLAREGTQPASGEPQEPTP